MSRRGPPSPTIGYSEHLEFRPIELNLSSPIMPYERSPSPTTGNSEHIEFAPLGNNAGQPNENDEETNPTTDDSQHIERAPHGTNSSLPCMPYRGPPSSPTGFSEHFEHRPIDSNLPSPSIPGREPTEASTGFPQDLEFISVNRSLSSVFVFGREPARPTEEPSQSDGTSGDNLPPSVTTQETSNHNPPVDWPSENEEDDDEDGDYEDDESEDEDNEDDVYDEDDESLHNNSEEDEDDKPPSTETTIIPHTGPEQTHTFIFLHGRGDYGSDLANSFFLSTSSRSPNASLGSLFPTIRFVFPTAPLLRSERRAQEFGESSLQGVEVVSQWFDPWDAAATDMKKDLMRVGLRSSINKIAVIVREEAEIVRWSNVILGGISQGCATALMALLQEDLQVGAFVGWCGWLPFRKEIESYFDAEPESWDQTRERTSTRVKKISEKEGSDHEVWAQEAPELAYLSKQREECFAKKLDCLSMAKEHRRANTPPMFFGHAEDDERVPYRMGMEMSHAMHRLGYDVRLKSYGLGGHWINAEHGVDDMAEFLELVFELKRAVKCQQQRDQVSGSMVMPLTGSLASQQD